MKFKSKKLEAKRPDESQIMTRKVVSTEHLNPHGTLFGGYLMAWIDEVAFMSARRHAGVPTVVTVNIDNISFLTPLKLGEHIMLTARVNYVGRSAMEIGVRVEKEDPYTGTTEHTNSAYLTFCALDKSSKPVAVAPLKLDDVEDLRRYNEAVLRLKVRKRLKNHLSNKLKSSNKKLKSKTPDLRRKSELLVGQLKNNLSKLTLRFEELDIVEKVKSFNPF